MVDKMVSMLYKQHKSKVVTEKWLPLCFQINIFLDILGNFTLSHKIVSKEFANVSDSKFVSIKMCYTKVANSFGIYREICKANDSIITTKREQLYFLGNFPLFTS